MRKNPTYDIEQFRHKSGPMASTKADGANGAFLLDGPGGVTLKVVCSDGTDWTASKLPPPAWEHVSVSCQTRCPTWEEMDFVKRIFWRDDELIVQFHVPRSQHINYHEHCLHMWRLVDRAFPQPPAICVGPT